MYSGYKLTDRTRRLLMQWATSCDIDIDDLYNTGKELYDKNCSVIQKSLNDFLLPGGSIDAVAIQNNWFPQIDADVFLSHSHADEKRVIEFAGLIYELFGLTTFIDSTVWGYANDLLKQIDDVYCRPDERRHPHNYSYESRNISTSHVHMMLSVALMEMVDNTECLFFYDTPDSISTYKLLNTSEETTKSPWIYAEMAMSRCVWRRKEEHKRRKTSLRKSLTESVEFSDMNFLYRMNTLHLNELHSNDFIDWMNQVNKYDDPLDALYSIVPPKSSKRRRV